MSSWPMVWLGPGIEAASNTLEKLTESDEGVLLRKAGGLRSPCGPRNVGGLKGPLSMADRRSVNDLELPSLRNAGRGVWPLGSMLRLGVCNPRGESMEEREAGEVGLLTVISGGGTGILSFSGESSVEI